MVNTSTLIFNITYSVFPWITYTILILGVIFQFSKYMGGKPSPPIERGKESFTQKIVTIILEVGLQTRMVKENFSSLFLWAFSWLTFHLPLAFVLFGHLRGLGVWSIDWFTWIVSEELLKETVPLIAGLTLMAGVCILLIRRLIIRAPRSISTLDNYIALLLVISVIVAGNIMRLLPHSPEPFSMIIPPGFSLTLEYTPSLDWLTIHGIMAQILVAYLPFSRLMHVFGVIMITIRRMIS